MFFLLYKYTDDGVFDDLPKISDHFPKIPEDFSKLFRRLDERSRTFSENFRKFPKMSEDFRRLPKTFEEDPKMFRWYTNEFKYNLRDELDITEIIDIFTSKDISYFIHTEIFASNFALWKSVSDFTSTDQRGETSFSHVKKSFRPITNHGLSELCFRGLFRGHRW